jgi:hypothetical protein
MKKTLFALAGLAVACAAHAEPDTQWKPATTTFATLVQSGYRIVAVTDHIYYLQRDASVMSCPEPRGARSAATPGGGSPFGCHELVEPYDSTAPQDAPVPQTQK